MHYLLMHSLIAKSIMELMSTGLASGVITVDHIVLTALEESNLKIHIISS